VNNYKVYDYEERAFESLGNIMNLSYSSFKLYCSRDLRLLRHSYLFSSKSLALFLSDDYMNDLSIFDIIKNKVEISKYYDLVDLDSDLLENNINL